MCKHTETLLTMRNAVVSVREGLYRAKVDILPFSKLSEEISRQENFYDYLIDEYSEECWWCIKTSEVPVLNRAFIYHVSELLRLWRIDQVKGIEPVEIKDLADWEKELLSNQSNNKKFTADCS